LISRVSPRIVGIDREFQKDFISHLRRREEVRYAQLLNKGVAEPITKDIFLLDTLLAMENSLRLEYVLIRKRKENQWEAQ